MLCNRCKKETNIHRMSFFNEDELCLECLDIESLHPMYAKAKEVEHQEVLKGNYNYPGIGLPEDFDEFVEKFWSKNI